MRYFYKSIISVFCCFAIAFSFFTVPAYAAGPFLDLEKCDFVSWFYDQAVDIGGYLRSFIDKDVCPYNPSTQKLHDFQKQYTTVDGVSAYYYVCKYCGKSAGEAFEPAYDNYVSSLPAPGYNSDGSLTISPPVYLSIWCNYGFSAVCPHFPKDVSCISREIPFRYSFNCESNTISLMLKEGDSSFQYYGGTCPWSFSYSSFEAPIDGIYTLLSSPSFSARYVDSAGSHTYSSSYGEASYGFQPSGHLFEVRSGYPSSPLPVDTLSRITFYSATFYSPVFKVVPYDSIVDDVNATYNINSRPTSISGGNYGIVGDNGQIIRVEDNSTIINETNNTFYNPATGTAAPIVNWSYDYSDRSYKVTLESGDTATITYGDENITIQEGDTIYNVYYLVDGSGSENPPSACDHAWTETSTTSPTCTLPGSKLFTCSKCQQIKTETLPALGHDWQVKQTVTTQFDDTGQLIQQGYTIFECSRCGEQYKSEDGTGPPDTPPEDPGEEEEKKGFFSWLWSVLTDALKKLIEGIIDAILKTLDFFFGGDSQSNYDFYNSPSTFSGVNVWGS